MVDKNTSAPSKVEQGHKPDKGTSTLLLGAGVGTYGAVSFTLTGAICPACLVLTPALLGFGAYKRIKFKQKMKPDS